MSQKNSLAIEIFFSLILLEQKALVSGCSFIISLIKVQIGYSHLKPLKLLMFGVCKIFA